MNFENMELAFNKAFTVSIAKFGFANFKTTSLFGSNEREMAKVAVKKAA
jgi:hypothetical protein